jgi:hypothetical protein
LFSVATVMVGHGQVVTFWIHDLFVLAVQLHVRLVCTS